MSTFSPDGLAARLLAALHPTRVIRHRFRRGETVFRQGDPASACEIASNGDLHPEFGHVIDYACEFTYRVGSRLDAKSDPFNPNLRSGIKAVAFIGSGVIVACDFTAPILDSTSRATGLPPS
jgi:hypothetical protein